MVVTIVTYTEIWNITFKTSKPPWIIRKYEINILHILKKTDYFGISKPTLYFGYCFYIPCVVLFTVFFHTVLSMFRFFCYWSQSKVNARFNFAFIKDCLSVIQSTVQAVTAENEKQYNFSNIIYIKFQNSFFFLRPSLKEVLLKCRQTN